MSVPQKRRRRPLPSADAIAGNEDLMTEILIRLPVKSLCRFKCVSRRWNSLISHPDFSHLRKPHSVSGFFSRKLYLPKEPSYKYVHIAGKRPRGSPFKSLPFVEDPSLVIILDSCNGLLFLQVKSCIGYRGKPHYYVFNPTTKQFAIIPPPCQLANHYVNSQILVFDPSRAPQYKIVCLLYSSGSHSSTYQIELYSSETGAWRFSGDPFTTALHFDKGVFFNNKIYSALHFDKGVLFNNKIHWPDAFFETWLLFDFDQQCLTSIPMPTIPDGRDEIIKKCFADSQGHLDLICGNKYILDVLQMESDYSKWFLKYCIHLDDIKATFPRCPFFSKLQIRHLVIREVEEESCLVFYLQGMTLSYNFKDKKPRRLCNSAQYEIWSDAHQYIETLVRIY